MNFAVYIQWSSVKLGKESDSSLRGEGMTSGKYEVKKQFQRVGKEKMNQWRTQSANLFRHSNTRTTPYNNGVGHLH
jgi:hypothetical protein